MSLRRANDYKCPTCEAPPDEDCFEYDDYMRICLVDTHPTRRDAAARDDKSLRRRADQWQPKGRRP